MSLLTSLPLIPFKSKSPRQVVSDSWEDRNDVLHSDVNLFCWKRPVDIVISSYLGQLLEEELKPITFHSHVNDIDENIRVHRITWDQEPFQAANLFWSDVARLTRDFLSYSENQSGTIHLKVINNNACSKFHTDGYALRLFTTYYGRGTEWLPEKATNRKGLGKTNEHIVKDITKVQQMDPFEVGILKGELPNSNRPGKGIVHKSPAINHSGEKRIILRIDI